MIKVYGFGGNEQVEDFSPFVLKVIAYMKATGIDYESINDQLNISKAPKKKLPFIDDNGKIIPDSYFILQYLKERYKDLDADLNPEQKAETHIIERNLDENFYWFIVYARWQTQEGWLNLRDKAFAAIPQIIRPAIAGLIRKRVLKQLHSQGVGRHSEEEIIHLAEKSQEAISLKLGNKEYYFGNKLSSIDIIIYAFIAQFLLIDIYQPLHDVANKYANLVALVQRIQTQIN